MTTMYEAAEQWIDAHLASCTSPTCGCSDDQREAMLDALIADWLGMES
jgi:hypothetical protein